MTHGQLAKLNEKIEQLALELLQSQQISASQTEFLTVLLSAYGHHQLNIDPIYADQSADEQDYAEQDHENMNEAESVQFKIEQLKISLRTEYDLEADFFDFDFAEDDLEDFMQKFSDKMLEHDQQEFLSQLEDQERQQIEREIEREKNKAAKKKQQRAQAKKNATQSIKAVYLKIVAMIHPDREQDEHKKQEKNELLQQVNQAYENKDLLALFTMQIELGQQQNQNLANEQCKAYNIILEEQLEKLTMEIEEIISSFNLDQYINMRPQRKLKVSDLYQKYQRDLLNVQQNIESNAQILEYYKDINTLKELMRSKHLWEHY